MKKLCALLLVLTACTKDQVASNSETKPSTSPGTEIEILVTGDLGSDTELCGCKAREMGGVARRAKIVFDREKERPGRTLVLDAGDHFFRTPLLSPRDEAQARETAHFLASTLKSMNVAAIAVGERDLAFGLKELRALEQESGAKLVSANLVYTASSTRAFEQFVLVERSGVKIGIVGASLELDAKAAAHVVYAQAGLKTIPPEPALLEAAKAARKAGASFVVALIHTGDLRARDAMVKLEPGAIDLAFTAHDRHASGSLELIGKAPSALTSSGERGKWLVSVKAEIVPGATSVANKGGIEGAKKSIQDIDTRIAQYQATTGADHSATIERLKKRKAQIETDLKLVTTAGKHALAYELIAIDVALPEDPTISAAFTAYKERLRVANAGVAPLSAAQIAYAGTKACGTCHQDELAQWKTTGHAHAWATLVRIKQTGNLDCVGCHTTGFDRPGGIQGLAGIEGFADVGCESCHGPGAAHAKNPKIALDHGKKVPERVCAECHRAQADQKPFDFEERLPRVLGIGHGR